jgi:hypothetical protein
VRTLSAGLLGAALGGLSTAVLFGLLMWALSPDAGSWVTSATVATLVYPFSFLVAWILAWGDLGQARVLLTSEVGIVAYLLGLHLMAATLGALVGGGVGLGLAQRRRR